ncbi:MAG: hypothetical protein AVDCRST_MAG04-1471, partial [uncultured Acetobacteraceae bacterium]
ASPSACCSCWRCSRSSPSARPTRRAGSKGLRRPGPARRRGSAKSPRRSLA